MESSDRNLFPYSYRVPLVHVPSCTPTKSNLYLDNALVAVVTELHLSMILTHTHTDYKVPTCRTQNSSRH